MSECRAPRPGLIAVWFFLLWLQVAVINVGLSGSASGATKSFLYFCQVSLFIIGPTNDILRALAVASGSGRGFLSSLCLFPRNYYGTFTTQV